MTVTHTTDNDVSRRTTAGRQPDNISRISWGVDDITGGRVQLQLPGNSHPDLHGNADWLQIAIVMVVQIGNGTSGVLP